MAFFRLKQGEKDDLAVGFGQNLDSGDGLTTPITVTVHEAGGDAEVAGFTVSSEAVNSSTVTGDNDDVDYAAGEAIEFRIDTGSVADGSYQVRVEAATDNGQTKVEVVPLKVEPPADPA